jgi:hypothetical protein
MARRGYQLTAAPKRPPLLAGSLHGLTQTHRTRSGGHMFKARTFIAAAAGAVLTVTLGACSSSEEPDPSGTSSSQAPSDAPSEEAAGQTAFTPQDVADPGEDLLGRIRLGKLFASALLKSSWKFPKSYETDTGETGRAYSKDEHFRITIQAGPGDQSAAADAMAGAQRQAEAKGQKASLHTVDVKNREFAVLVQDTPEAGIITYAHAPEGDLAFYIVQLATDMNLADVPQEQFDAFLQTLGSLEFER